MMAPVLLVLVTISLLQSATAAAQGSAPVPIAEVRGVINPVMAAYVDRVITSAESARASAIVLVMDTPGGLDVSMREINQRILRSTVPVVVYVYPPGARAGSAGVFISYAAHVAAMAPSTNIGSAHPVNLVDNGQSSGGNGNVMLEKVTNDSVAGIRALAELRGRNAEWAEQAIRESANLQASEALRLNVVDLLADDEADLLRKIDGRTVRVGNADMRISIPSIERTRVPMNAIEWLLHAVSDPTIAYLLMSLGGLALIYELSNPGAILPGVVGGIALLLALYALGTLPINLAGVGLILFALLLFLVEILFTNSGFLTVGGVISFILGSLVLALTPDRDSFLRVSMPAAITTLVIVTGFFTLVLAAIVRVQRQRPVTGREAMIGALGVAKTGIGTGGTVLVTGELWQASVAQTSQPIAAGQRVRVIGVDGLHLTVQPE
jgi:membrane-bound serine protease (ClpP class)